MSLAPSSEGRKATNESLPGDVRMLTPAALGYLCCEFQRQLLQFSDLMVKGTFGCFVPAQASLQTLSALGRTVLEASWSSSFGKERKKCRSLIAPIHNLPVSNPCVYYWQCGSSHFPTFFFFMCMY